MRMVMRREFGERERLDGVVARAGVETVHRLARAANGVLLKRLVNAQS